MTTNATERRAAIARLVAQGYLKHEMPGQYFSDDLPEAARSEIPQYDIKALQQAFPDALEMNFDAEIDRNTDEPRGLFLCIMDGNPDANASVRIPLGTMPPQSTEALIAIIHEFYAAQFDMSSMDETAAALAAFDGDE